MEKLRTLAMLYNVLKIEDIVVPEVEQQEEFAKMVEDAGYNPTYFDLVVVLNDYAGYTASRVVEEMVSICELL